MLPSCNGRKRGFTSSSSLEKPGSTIFGVSMVEVGVERSGIIGTLQAQCTPLDPTRLTVQAWEYVCSCTKEVDDSH
jgi:hypothetical protein